MYVKMKLSHPACYLAIRTVKRQMKSYNTHFSVHVLVLTNGFYQ